MVIDEIKSTYIGDFLFQCDEEKNMQNLKNFQNFLVDKNLVRNLIQKSQLNKNDIVVEIGPGKGIITNLLAEQVGNVIAIEYDENLYKALVSQNQFDNIEYVYDDFLKYHLPRNQKYKVFSNIPFQITADIIKKITDDNNPAEDIFLIVQKEAAKKYCGMPFQKYEGLRAAVVKAQYQVEIIHTFNRRDFSPAPNVDTVLLHFKRKSNTLNQSDYKNYKDLVAYIYYQGKGDRVQDRLGVLFSNAQIRRLCKDNRINPVDSYTKINSEQWMKIFTYSQIGLTEEKKRLVNNAYRRLEKVNKGLKKQNRTFLRKTSTSGQITKSSTTKRKKRLSDK